MFLINSCLDLFSAPGRSQDPLSRSYGVSLPNSLTMNLPTPQYALPDYLCRSAVRMTYRLSLADFLGGRITRTVSPLRKRDRTLAHQLRERTSLLPSTPKRFNAQFRMCAAVSLPRPRVALKASNGILTVSAIGIAIRLSLRNRLTPG